MTEIDMSNPISNNNPLPRVQQGGTPAKNEAPQDVGQEEAVSKPASDVVLDSNVAQALKESDFDQAAVDSIKAAIESGNYPLDDRKIAESFIPLEKLL